MGLRLAALSCVSICISICISSIFDVIIYRNLFHFSISNTHNDHIILKLQIIINININILYDKVSENTASAYTVATVSATDNDYGEDGTLSYSIVC